MRKAAAVIAPEADSAFTAVVGNSLREEHKRITRQRVVAAAESLFKENGFRATTVEQIAKAAGTTATTFYRHFKSKSELVSIVDRQLTVEVLGVLRKLEAVRNPTRKAVRTWLNQYCDMWQRIHVLCDAFWEATSEDPALAGSIMPNSMDMTGQLTSLLKYWPETLRERAQLRLTFLVISLDRIAYLVHSQGEQPQDSPILDEFADIFWTSLFDLKA